VCTHISPSPYEASFNGKWSELRERAHRTTRWGWVDLVAVGTRVYTASRSRAARGLQRVGFPDPSLAHLALVWTFPTDDEGSLP